MPHQFIIPDTNLFVAAGFNRRSSSAQIIQAATQDQLHFTWNQATLAETRFIIQKIPPLHWDKFVSLFKHRYEYTNPTHPEKFSLIQDPDDRKFAALAAATHHPIITNDDHLLSVRSQLDIDIYTPSEFVHQ